MVKCIWQKNRIHLKKKFFFNPKKVFKKFLQPNTFYGALGIKATNVGDSSFFLTYPYETNLAIHL
jgi:hypothetical protein